jgi:hypothetical protein
MGVGKRERLAGEPGIGDEAACAGGAHHVAAPQGIDAEDGVAQDFGEAHRIMLANLTLATCADRLKIPADHQVGILAEFVCGIEMTLTLFPNGDADLRQIAAVKSFVSQARSQNR